MINRYGGVRFKSPSIAAIGVDFIDPVIARQVIL
jgi:hypothetical protein